MLSPSKQLNKLTYMNVMFSFVISTPEKWIFSRLSVAIIYQILPVESCEGFRCFLM